MAFDLSDVAKAVKDSGKDKVCKELQKAFDAVTQTAKSNTAEGDDFTQNAAYKEGLKTYNDGVEKVGCSADKLTMGLTMLLVLFTIWKMMMK